MTESVDSALFGLICAAALWLALLRAGSRLERVRSCLGVKLGIGAGAGLLLFVPVAGLPLWSWAFGFCPNPSLLLFGLICAELWRELAGTRWFGPAEWRAACGFGASAGTVLYLHPFCFEAIDLYNWGWHETVATWGIAAVAVTFLCWGNRLGILFIAALAAFEFGALESHNAWDYLIDPLYWITSCAVLGVQLVRWCLQRRGRRGPAVAPPPRAVAAAGAVELESVTSGPSLR